jgi:hypothetical protein
VKTSSNEADYEPLRVWALYPSSVRPPGVAQFLRGGLITWLQTTQALTHVQERSVPRTSTPTEASSTPLIGLVATMIAEVLP